MPSMKSGEKQRSELQRDSVGSNIQLPSNRNTTCRDRSGEMVKNDRVEKIPLSEAVTHLMEECRTVLPGIQAMFGFQLIVVFNPSFQEKLSAVEHGLHLIAIGLNMVAIAMIMAPAAYHRQKDPHWLAKT